MLLASYAFWVKWAFLLSISTICLVFYWISLLMSLITFYCYFICLSFYYNYFLLPIIFFESFSFSNFKFFTYSLSIFSIFLANPSFFSVLFLSSILSSTSVILSSQGFLNLNYFINSPVELFLVPLIKFYFYPLSHSHYINCPISYLLIYRAYLFTSLKYKSALSVWCRLTPRKGLKPKIWENLSRQPWRIFLCILVVDWEPGKLSMCKE